MNFRGISLILNSVLWTLAISNGAYGQSESIDNGQTRTITVNTFYSSLTVKNGGTLVVTSGDTLTVGSVGTSASTQVVDFQNKSTVRIDAGGVLIINGKFNNSNNSDNIVINGVLKVNGNVDNGNGGVVSGTGVLTSTGTISNSGTIFGGSGSCSIGPCSGNTLCSYSNTTGSTQNICSGSVPAALTGNTIASSSYSWESSKTASDAGYTAATGINNTSGYSPGVQTQNTWYRRTVIAAGCTSKVALQITVSSTPPSITAQPSSSSICSGGNTSFSILTSGSGLTYQWQVNNGSGWTNISVSGGVYSNFASNTLSLNSVSNSYNNYQYRCIVSRGSCASTSNAATLTILAGGTWIGGTGSWNNASNWCGGVPNSSKDLFINSGDVTINSSNAQCRDLVISPTASLTLSGTNGLTVYGNWTNNGAFYQNSGTVSFSGNSIQSIGGNNTFEDLTINNSTGVSISSGTGNQQTINGTLTLTSGTFTTNANLTMDLDQGGAIAGTGTGSISGNITVKRYFTAGFHYIGECLNGTTLGDIADDVPMYYGSFFTYQENVNSTDMNNGWVFIPINPSTTLTGQKNPGGPSQMVGYALQVNSPATIDLTGTYNHNATYNTGLISFQNSGLFSSDGWQLVSNPYPSYVDWNNATGWTKTHVDGAITYYNPELGKNADYIPATADMPEASTNGGSPYIPAMSAFWIKTNAADAVLTVNNNARVINPNLTPYAAPSFYRNAASSAHMLKITASGWADADETIVRFGTSATADFDNQIDSYKFKNEGNCPSIYSTDAHTEYSINSLPAFTNDQSVDLNFEAYVSGPYTLALKENTLDPSVAVILEDKLLNKKHNMTTSGPYSFDANFNDTHDRFVLYFAEDRITSAQAAEQTSEISISGQANDVNISIGEAYGNESTSVQVYDMSGREIYNRPNAGSGNISLKLNNIHMGMYVIKVEAGNKQCTQRLFLGE
jgi:hypothetical protein